ncbi:MAG TPA: class II aldolase/adducin family protein [Acidimicrobiales bacterium]|nr:class II aldolase/adducin family protein [Acidimicrobiales bacterium]
MSFEDVKYEVCIANRILAEVGLATGVLASLGHSSMRVPEAPDRFIVKGRGYEIDALAAMRPELMIVCDLDGNKIEGPPNSTQCFEVKMHSSIYKMYPNITSVTHVHPRYAVVMSVLQAKLMPMCQEGAELVSKSIPVYPHVKTILTDEEGTEVATLLDGGPVILLEGHGATTTGSSLEQSVMNMLWLEEQARMNWYAFCAAGPNHRSIPPENVAEMSGRTPLAELPHFVEPMREHTPRVGGVWTYYSQVVERGL